MEHWLNKESEINNAVLLNRNGIAIGSCDKDVYDKVDEQLKAKVNPIEIFGTDDLRTIPFTQIHSITSRSTDTDIDVCYKAKKGIEDETIDFSGVEEKLAFVKSLDRYIPQQLRKTEHQQSALSAALSPAISLLFGVALITAYFNKFRWAALIIGGIWIAFSLATLVRRAGNPPKITRWKISGKYFRRIWDSIKTGYSYVFVVILALGFSVKFSDNYGEKSLYEHQLKNELAASDIPMYLDRGADINYRDKDGDTPLRLAIYAEDEQLTLALIAAGASLKTDPNSDGDSLLAYALYNDASNAVIKALIDGGAETNIKIGEQSLLEYAQQNQLPELERLLLAQ